MSSEATLKLHQHGKGRVRVGRTWRVGNVHYFVEWNVFTMLESPMEHAFIQGDNTGMTATDTQKNTVYVVAQRMPERSTADQFAIALAQFYVKEYPLVTKAKILVEEKPWKRVTVNGVPHDHGYSVTGTEIRTAYAEYDKAGKLSLTAGLKEWQVLKTTQSGYTGFLRDKYTALGDSTDRILATSITSTWKYSTLPSDFDAAFNSVKNAIVEAFYGPPHSGVYSPSVQYTLYQMAVKVLGAVSQVESIFFNTPNLHFIPLNPMASKFNNDVYVATSEPHGNIECVVTRKDAVAHQRF
jgi:urate oxidase